MLVYASFALILLTDLKETLAPMSCGRDADELRRAFEQLQEITRLMTNSDTIFFAAVRGWAVGGGAEVCVATNRFDGEAETLM